MVKLTIVIWGVFVTGVEGEGRDIRGQIQKLWFSLYLFLPYKVGCSKEQLILCLYFFKRMVLD